MSGFVTKSQIPGLAFHFLTEACAHHLAEFIDNGIGNEADAGQAFLAHRDHAGLAKDGEMF